MDEVQEVQINPESGETWIPLNNSLDESMNETENAEIQDSQIEN